MPHIVVIGAGITGLTAARRLIAAGAQVTVLEAAPRVGGQLHTTRHAGIDLDVGAEAMYAAIPAPVELARELGHGEDIVPAAAGTTWIRTERGLKPLPAGFGPAGPTRLWPVLRAGVLSPAGAVRAGLEPLRGAATIDDDTSVGGLLDERFGSQVTDRLVDPLLGGLHSGDVRKLSVTAATPQLAAVARSHRSLLLRRRRPPGPGPTFVTLRGGMQSLPRALAAGLPAGTLHLDTEVVTIEAGDGDRRGAAGEMAAVGDRSGGRVTVVAHDGRTWSADGVVLTTPARVAAPLLDRASPEAAAAIGALRAASVAVTLLSYPAEVADTPALAGTGLLVPSRRGQLLKAATFLSTKWPHLLGDDVSRRNGPQRFHVRASAGRIDDHRVDNLDDGELAARVHQELVDATGLSADPLEVAVHRWPRTMPQLEVGHAGRLAAATTALARDLPGVVLAGAPYVGPGLGACLRSANVAVDRFIPTHQELPA